MSHEKPTAQDTEKKPAQSGKHSGESAKHKKEIGGQKGPEPTRYGDWEKNGRCTDF